LKRLAAAPHLARVREFEFLFRRWATAVAMFRKSALRLETLAAHNAYVPSFTIRAPRLSKVALKMSTWTVKGLDASKPLRRHDRGTRSLVRGREIEGRLRKGDGRPAEVA